MSGDDRPVTAADVLRLATQAAGGVAYLAPAGRCVDVLIVDAGNEPATDRLAAALGGLPSGDVAWRYGTTSRTSIEVAIWRNDEGGTP